MATQTEYTLEQEVVAQLQKLGYAAITIRDEKELVANLKVQLELHNNIKFSATEFDRVLNILNKGSVFEKAKTLRQKQHILRDNGDNLYFEFIDIENWCQNRFQVTSQVTMIGAYKNRYDVTLLINGMPLVQLELKRRGLELKEAFNQINRYHRHSYGFGSALYHYVQVFVISNGVNTKYYANNSKQHFNQTFYWADKDNKRLTNILNGFASEFLEPCHISKMICKYIVLSEATKSLMVLRPYQYYAVEAIVERVKNTNKNGYIWHTTGSGKTLTSYKTSQVLTSLPEIKKVVFVVDRKDLDYQTTLEFNSFSAGSVDGTDNTHALVKQLSDDTKLIVTTIQKLNAAISKPQYLSRMQKLKDEKMVFIFDECHRSQFGDTHKNITDFFSNIQMFGFTGTPIFADNAVRNESGRRTTKDLFAECLHKYVITDAIRDENVLKFAVEYVGRYKQKEGRESNIDIEVEDIDTKELMNSPQRLEKITDYIIANHNRKTHSQKFTGMFCVSSVDTLTKYYDFFQQKKQAGEHNLKIATIFSYVPNEDDADANGFLPDELPIASEPKVLYGLHKHTREKLDYIGHYNEMFGTKFSTKDSETFYNYYNDISKKVKERKIDILLVVNMFLTGFDSKTLNTLYVDKNLKHHGLIQAYSRTNRIFDDLKSQGNIVVFRNLKAATDDAIILFSNKDAIEVIIMQPYEDYVVKFNEGYKELLKIAPTVDSVNELLSENEKLAFVQAFRNLIRIKNILTAFSDFKWIDLVMQEQEFADYQSKYLDLYDSAVKKTEKASILDDVDFELELIHRDEINVAYILQLLIRLKSRVQSEVSKAEIEIFNLLGTENNLRSKRELIERFIQENLPVIEEPDDIPQEFEKFWRKEQDLALNKLIEEEHLIPEETNKLITNYLFTEHEPITDDVVKLLADGAPKITERKPIAERIKKKIVQYTQTFIIGMPIISA